MLRALTRRLRGRSQAFLFGALLRSYPPFLGAGIRAESISSDLRSIVVAMPLTRLNRNYVGTHFGGSLFAMTDPFFMLMLIENLGREYLVWDKRSTIRFRRPGVGTVRAVFGIDDALLDRIRIEVDNNGRHDVEFHVDIVGEEGEIVAEIDKVVQIRKRK